jgi:hypothetical protein
MNTGNAGNVDAIRFYIQIGIRDGGSMPLDFPLMVGNLGNHSFISLRP